MTQNTDRPGEPREEPPSTSTDLGLLGTFQVAEFEIDSRPLKVRASARLSPIGFVAIGVMVSAILLATSSLVWSATSAARIRAGRRGRSD